ncbi:30S ribosomal protein S4 [Candidatus Uhrbacteria bacterium]|nr:30S ribosomal protein S4 [Candidatus Uhrbacteria bacterium]
MASVYRVTCKMCRREGVSLCGRVKCAVKRRPSPPGIHGPNGYGKLTPYGTQLREKQKVKRSYGLRERQMRRYYDIAIGIKGNTGTLMGQALELRLDSVVVRSGYAQTQFQARQIVSHGHITVNGKRVDVPSYQTKPGDVIGLKRNGSGQVPTGIKSIADQRSDRALPQWIAINNQTLEATIVRRPEANEMPPQFNIRSIVEFYSR